LRDLGHTQRTFAAFARVADRSVRRWASGDQIVPGWAMVIIRLLDKLQRAGIGFAD
jgi:DNA-binding transcriptional regulator YiaG